MKRLKYLKYALKLFFFFRKWCSTLKYFIFTTLNFVFFWINLHHEFTAIHKLTKKKKKTDVTVSATLAFARQFMTLWIANWNNLKKEFVRKEK